METLSKTLPFSNTAEQSVLGSILIDPECFSDVSSKLKSDEFYVEMNREVFLAMQNLFIQSKSIDAVTVVTALSDSDAFKNQTECENYIKTIALTVPTSANINDYVKIVHDKFLLRKLIEVCDGSLSQAYTTSDDAELLINATQEQLFSISDNEKAHDFVHIRDALVQNFNTIKQIRENPESVSGTKTGYSALDSVLIGMSPGDLILVGARPGMGKTSFSMNIATKVAMSTKKTVCVFSLEMSAEQLTNRMLSSEALVESGKLRSANLTTDDYVKLANASSALSECDILIDDTTGTSVASMRSKIRKLRKEISLIVIDYLQLMSCDRKIDNRVLEVGEISRGLKLLAKDLKVPIICCAQLSRGPESRTDKRPMLSDLRDSGAIEQDADVVLFLYRDEYYDTKKDGSADTQNTAEIIVAKNRHGESKNIKMGWLGQFTKFTTLDNSQQQ